MPTWEIESPRCAWCSRFCNHDPPTQLPGWTALSALLLKQNRVAEAETVIRQSVEQNHDSVGANYLLAAFLLQQQRLKEAEPIFKNISSLEESDPNQRLALGNFYASTRRLEMAEQEYLRVANKY